MNDQTTLTAETALTLPEASKLPGLFQRGEIDTILERIEEEALAIAPDLGTAKGRKEVVSLAHKVARSKTALDAAGKSLTDEARKQIAVVDAERRKVRDRLDNLKGKVRKPLDEWEAAEEARKAAHRERMAIFAKDRMDWSASSSDLQSLIAEIEVVEVDETWEEFQALAQDAKAEALDKYRADLKAAQTREDQEKELARLRAEKKAQEQKEREEAARRQEEEDARRRAEQKRADQLARAKSLTEHITECQNGTICGQPQPFGVLLYELENKLEPEMSKEFLGEHLSAVETLRKTTADHLHAAMERQKVVADERAERERKEAEDRARKEAEEAERQRAAREREAEQKERKKRENNARHRAKIMREIASAIADIPTADLPQAMLDGKVPHVRVHL